MRLTVKTAHRRPRLPKRYKLQLARAGITHERVALESPGWHPFGVEVTRQFITLVLSGRQRPPAWVRIEMDALLAKAKAAPAAEGN